MLNLFQHLIRRHASLAVKEDRTLKHVQGDRVNKEKP